MSQTLDVTNATAAPEAQVHVFLLIHGLWGSPSHLAVLEELILKRAQADKLPSEQIKVLLPANNEWTNTYDGIDFCAERLATELERVIAETQEAGQRVTKFSLIGYSLGGLVARFLLGILETQEPSFFKSITPINFMTIASPAIGIPAYSTFFSPILHYLGSRLLSRSGKQLYTKDEFVGKKPLLEVMADPNSSFVRALQRFQKVSIYANAVNDRTVPYPTAALSKVDPFAIALNKTHKARKDRGALQKEPINLEEGGMRVVCDTKYPGLVTSFATVEPLKVATAYQGKREKSARIRIPRLLRPSSYPFWPKPVRYIFVWFMPVALPAALLFLIGRFAIQSFHSNRRIQMLAVGDLKTHDGRLARVGFRNAMSEEETHTLMRRPSVTEEMCAMLNDSLIADVPQIEIDPAHTKSSQPALTASQKKMIKGFSKQHVPQMWVSDDTSEREPDWDARELYLAFLPEAMNAHACVIARDPARFEQHHLGRPILQHFVDHCIL